jgi:SAM-dependent methyltransferase
MAAEEKPKESYALRIDTAFDADALRAKLKEWEPWGHRIDFSNGVSTAEFKRRTPFGVNPLLKFATAAKRIPFEQLGGGALLDIGCNAGYNSIHCAAKYQMQAVGIDIAPRHIKVSRFLSELARVQAEYLLDSAEVFARPEAFDVILHFGTLYHLRNPLLSLSKAYENLRPGGWLALETQVYDDPKDDRICYFMHMHNNDPTNYWALSMPVLKNCLRLTGFEGIEELLRARPPRLGKHMSRVILVARKPDSEGRPNRATGSASAPAREPDTAPARHSRCEGVIAVVGLARSGTTLLAAMLSAHPDIHMVFEPWNANKKKNPRPTDVGVKEFISAFKVDMTGKRILGIKETAQRDYLDGVGNVLSDAPAGMLAIPIWVYRNPLHIYLSHLQAMKEWWGRPEQAVSLQSFDRWAASSVRRMCWLLDMLLSFQGVCISYEAMVSNPEDTMRRLMRTLGLPLADDVLNYHIKRNRTKPCGDRHVRNSHEPASTRSIERRERELSECIAALKESKFMPVMQALRKRSEQLAEEGVIAADHELAKSLSNTLLVRDTSSAC